MLSRGWLLPVVVVSPWEHGVLCGPVCHPMFSFVVSRSTHVISCGLYVGDRGCVRGVLRSVDFFAKMLGAPGWQGRTLFSLARLRVYVNVICYWKKNQCEFTETRCLMNVAKNVFLDAATKAVSGVWTQAVFRQVVTYLIASTGLRAAGIWLVKRA